MSSQIDKIRDQLIESETFEDFWDNWEFSPFVNKDNPLKQKMRQLFEVYKKAIRNKDSADTIPLQDFDEALIALDSINKKFNS